MIRGTTPTLSIKLNNISVERFSSLYITLNQHDIQLTKELSDVTLDSANNKINIWLSQAETLAFEGSDVVEIQLRGMADGQAVASGIVRVPMIRILKEGEIS